MFFLGLGVSCGFWKIVDVCVFMGGESVECSEDVCNDFIVKFYKV